MIVNLSQFIFIAVVFLVFLMLMGCLVVVFRKHKQKILDKLKVIKDKMIWNGLIRSVSMGYLNLCIAAVVKVQDMRRYPETATTAGIATAAAMLTFLVGYFLVTLIVLVKNRRSLDWEEKRESFGLLYDGIEIHRSKFAILYYPMFILRRVTFMMIPVAFMGHPSQ